MMVRRTALTLVMSLCLASGCYSFRSQMADNWIAIRNAEEARQAWLSCRDIYIDCEPNLYDFGLGFRAGYSHVAGGGVGCPPTLPPQRYWSARYQDDCGRQQVVAWYNGWSHGVEVALRDGVGNRNQMVTSLQLYPQCRTQTEITLPDSHANAYGEEVPGWNGGAGQPLEPTPLIPQLTPPSSDLY